MRGSFGGLRCCVDVLPQVREGKLEEGGREEVGELQEVEHGAHADLLAADGVYRRLWNAQDTATAGGLP